MNLLRASATPVSTRQALQSRIAQMQGSRLEEPAHPTLPQLGGLLPGGLRMGSSYSVIGSTTLALSMLAAASAGGGWCGVFDLPDLGVEAAAALGIDLGRLVWVKANPGTQWVTTVAAMADILSVFIAPSPARISPAEISRLGARLRQNRSTLIVLGEWPPSASTLRVVATEWSGIAAGHGHLAGRRLHIDVTARAGAGRRRRQLEIPADLWREHGVRAP